MDKRILSLLRTGHENATSRESLAKALGVGDRECRKLIQDARNDGAIILNRQDGKGYYLAGPEDVEELARQYWQDTSRALSILRRRKTIRRLLREMGVSV